MRAKLLAEFLGTFFLVFAGTGAIVINQISGGAITHAGIALTFGLVVLALIYTFGDISGAHFNPAVTLGFAAAGRFPAKEIPAYVLVQCAGAIAASFALQLLFPAHPTLGATLPAGSAAQSFALEFILTLFLMLAILGVSTGSKEKGITAGIAVGAVIALEAMFAGPISGASMNPARSLGPALASGHWEHFWLYPIATIAGALAAIPLHAWLRPAALAQPSPAAQPAFMPLPKVLFVCIHNSARSQMAEAFVKKLCPGSYDAESAGLEPGKLNPFVVQAMSEKGIDISANRTKSVQDILQTGQAFRHVVAVCDQEAAERCPIFPGQGQRHHWAFPDPSSATGGPEEKLAKAREVRDLIHRQIESWCATWCQGPCTPSR